jgi:adenine phosphoribosyltransferase
VIHAQDDEQIDRNIEIAVRCGAQGVFLINHGFDVTLFLPLIERCRQAYPLLWLGVNFLGVTGRDAFPILGELESRGLAIDAYWADDACIDEQHESQSQAGDINFVREESGWSGIYFGGTAFKKQRAVDPADYLVSGQIAAQWMDVVTTSGVATGEAAEIEKIETFRQGVGAGTLAVASGITPENVHDYAPYVDAILVATGINLPQDFYNIDRTRLSRLIDNCRCSAVHRDASASLDGRSSDRSYLRQMAPTVKGDTFAWLDPSSAYINGRAFAQMVDDLLHPFRTVPIDVVAGIDAAGYVLGAALATRLGTGILTVRKAGKLPVPTEEVEFINYSKRTQSLELRKPAFRPGTRVLLVDQWVETGGTMGAAIELIERQGGLIAGIATVAIEENAQTNALRKAYFCVSSVLFGSDYQTQCNQKHMAFFDDFDWECIFPDIR